jgi:uncharacterized protein (TIGR00288 family)
MIMQERKFALLIDSDNISAKYINAILDEMQKYGVITYKRIYGDWTNNQTSKWKNELLENSIIPVQQFSNTVGKNATDSALIIDAMDILYTDNVEGFCIVSSDSDFTRLASRLRESGMMVIGMGEDKTPRSFRAACSVFTNLEILIDQEIQEKEVAKPVIATPATIKVKPQEEPEKPNQGVQDNTISKQVIENAIVSIITENENQGKTTDLGVIGNRLVNKFPDFDVRNYGYSLLSKFLEEFKSLELIRMNSTVTVALKDNKTAFEEMGQYVLSLIKSQSQKQMGLSELSNKLHLRNKEFNVKDYGYSTFSKFIQSIDQIEIIENGKTKRTVRLKKEET